MREVSSWDTDTEENRSGDTCRNNDPELANTRQDGNGKVTIFIDVGERLKLMRYSLLRSGWGIESEERITSQH